MTDKAVRPIDYRHGPDYALIPQITWGEHRAIVARYQARVRQLERELALYKATGIQPLNLIELIARDSRPVPPANKVLAGHGYVYIIQSIKDNTCKIGMSRSFKNRHQQFAAKLPFQWETVMLLQCRDYKGLESYLHRRYSAKRLDGEWFELTAHDIVSIWNDRTFFVKSRYFGRFAVDHMKSYMNDLYELQNEYIIRPSAA